MADTNKNIPVTAEQFRFVHEGERIHDKKFDDKPIGYFKDAWLRFRKSKASVIAAIIILLIVVYTFVAPLMIARDATFMCGTYAKKGPRISWLREYGMFTGGSPLNANESGYIKNLAIGVAAEDVDGLGNLTMADGMNSKYQPVISTGEAYVQQMPGNKTATYYPMNIDTYLQVGFLYTDVEQAEYARIVAWQEETGLQVLYPLIENNSQNPDPTDANNWYKMKKRGQVPLTMNEEGKLVEATFSEDLVLVDNYMRDADGNAVYYKFSGGGTLETAQYRIRVLYYNYYQYLYGMEPDYLLGTDSQGYDLALRIAGGIQLSLAIAIGVFAINFIIGAFVGAISGYYGGWVDIVLQRLCDILSGVPFIVVATLFQIYLAKNLHPIICLLFAYVLTGWIGTAGRVRTQFYRFKHSEYVMAARTLGASDMRIMFKHIFPNSLGTIITSSALSIPGVILNESMLSFLGIIKLGNAEGTSLGTLLSEASGIWTNYPHLMLFPAIIISLLMVCFNLFGNGLRDAFNPALRGVED